MLGKATEDDDMAAMMKMMAIPNSPDRHAFVMLGTQSLFLCHLTMFHMENHCYQAVIEGSLPPQVMSAYVTERTNHPADTYFLGNLDQDRWIVPELQTGRRKSFVADIWRGIPFKKKYEEWPWNYQAPIISSVPVTIERVVYYRHFDFNLEPPKTLSYLLFGDGDQAFLTHYQVKKPDFDQVVTLKSSPKWLPEEQLRAGVPINIPDLHGGFYSANPLSNQVYAVQYAGFHSMGEKLTIDVAHSDWFCTKVVNDSSPSEKTEDPESDRKSCEAGPPSVETLLHQKDQNCHAGND